MSSQTRQGPPEAAFGRSAAKIAAALGIALALAAGAARGQQSSVQSYEVPSPGAKKLLEEGDFRGALAEFNEAIKLMVQHYQTLADNRVLVEAYAGRARALIGLGRTEQADREILGVLRSGYWGRHGVDPSLQIDVMTRWLEKEPNNVEYLMLRGEAYRHASRYEKYRDDASKRIEVARDKQQRAAAYIDRSIAQALLKDDAAAIADSSRAIELQPSPANYVYRSKLYEHLQDLPRAVADLTAALALVPETDPRHREYQSRRASVHFRTGDFAAARRDLDELLAGGDKDSALLEMRAEVLISMGEDALVKQDLIELTRRDAKRVKEVVLPKLNKLLKERLAAKRERPLDRATGKLAWELGTALVESATAKLIGSAEDDEEGYRKSFALAKQRAAKLGVELQPLPPRQLDRALGLKATVEYVSQARLALGKKLAYDHDLRMAYVFRLATDVGLASSTAEFSVLRLNHQISKLLLADGKESGLPEPWWRPPADLLAKGAPSNDVRAKLRELEAQAAAFFSGSPAGEESSTVQETQTQR